MFWFVLANLLVDWLSGVFWCVFECSVVSIIVHTYSDIFENGFFFRFSKKYPSTGSVFESFSPVHMKTLKRWKYDSIPYWEMCHAGSIWCIISYQITSVFVRPLKHKKPAFSKSPLWRAFLKRCRFVDCFHRVRVDNRPNRRKKIRFQTKTDMCGRGLTVFVDQFRFPGNCPPTPPLSHHFALSEK